MKLKSLALAAIAVTSFGAQAALTTYAPWDAAFVGNGLAGVLFNVQQANGVTVALGAHAYKNGVFLANDGVSIFEAANGVYAPDGLGRANWSFDFAWDLGTACAGCVVTLQADKDPTAGVNMVNLFSTAVVPASFPGESWNMEMAFITAGVYDFDPFSASSTAFRLEVRDAAGAVVVGSNITVNVPEPGSLALAGIALAGLASLRRRKA